MVPAAVVIVFIIRPFAGYVALMGTSLPQTKRMIISFYGIRGIGSIYYLLYALYHTQFEQSKQILALVTVVIMLSIVAHGMTARYIINRYVN